MTNPGPDWAALATRLSSALQLVVAPIGIAFLAAGEDDLAPAFEAARPEPNAAGRTGAVPAGCVFWMKAPDGPFSTVASDHANCSVGSYTHGSGLGLMTLESALPRLRIEGKPQCHIIAIAKERGEAAASVGCALGRARTGMKAHEMTCALPAPKLGEIVAAIEAAVDLDRAMARYASADARRFPSPDPSSRAER